MNQFATRMAWRYLTQKNQNSRMKIMLFICFIGIFIGSFALCLVLSIMNGFQIATYKQLKSINPEIELYAYGKELAVEPINNIINKEFPEIIATSSYDIQQGLVFTPYEESPTQLVIIKGIDPHTENTVSGIVEKIMCPKSNNLDLLLHKNTILIGKKLAQDLSVIIGNSLEIYFTHYTDHTKKIKLQHKEVTIAGIFDTGIDEFDSNLILCSFDTLKQLFPFSGPTHINVRLDNSANLSNIKERLHTRFSSLHVMSWKDRYPAIFSALQLEKYAMFFILILITLVASMNIIALLSMHISSKRSDIAILRAMGIPLFCIKRIFVLFGIIITTAASIAGIICAVLTSWIIEHYPCIQLPDVYYVQSLPAHMDFSIIFLVFCVIMIVSSIALAIAIYMIHTIQIIKVLRFEA